MFGDAWSTVAVVHLAATGAMAGVLLTIHFVHYPMFVLVDPARYEEFQRSHMRRISLVLIVPWGVEVLSAAYLLLAAPTGTLRLLTAIGGVGVLATLGITGLWAAPVHGRLVDGFDETEHRALLRADAVRTAIWCARAILAVAIVLVATG